MKLNVQNKQVVSLFTASILGTVIGVINSALNTNYLDPVSYGDVKYVQNIINFISSLLLFGFFVSGSRLLALSNDKEKSRELRGGLIVILLFTNIVIALTLGIYAVYNGLTGNETMSELFWIAMPVSGNVILLNYINTTAQGDNQIGRISLARFLPGLLYFIIALLYFKFIGASSESMLFLFNGISTAVLILILISTKPSFQNLKETFRILREENKKYGIHVYLGSIAGVSTTYIAGITLGAFCSNNTNVGFYTLALSLATPLSLLPTIIGTTYFKRFAHETKISKEVIRNSIIVTLSSFVLFIIGIKILVTLIYPANYNTVATYASFIAIATSFHGYGDMINRFLGSHGQGKQIRNSAFTCGSVILIGSIVFVYFWGIEGAILTRILGSTSYLVMMIYYYEQFKKSNL